ncbi:MAG TPA: glycosyl hydrolase [Thermoanaerobaculia bacterium]|nr:glycosyl hydrolase [Thermoanaerobaculia bacterium]
MRLDRLALAALALLLAAPLTAAEKKKEEKKEPEARLSSGNLAGLEWRGIGPAFMSGRIADLAIQPGDPSVWYVAVGSGGVWKTTNGGTTFKPLFDGQSSYSIGCVTIDPSNPSTVWVGTGENVGGRHVGFGDGIYVSRDGGASWEKRGLTDSQHLSKIVVHPSDPNTLWVAAQGPLWSPGGERGIYKTTDAGATWKKVLGAGEWTGATDIVLDPRDPKLLYAATWQHQRTVAAYLGGGPESGIHKSTDGGETWTKLKTGLPEGNLGKIGLAVSPQNPDVVYAAIELDRRTGGIWRSADRGASWEKRSDRVSGATGPHYYQELYASPHVFDRIYLMDTVARVSDDGGKTWRDLGNERRHVDNHALAFRADDPDYLLVGTDGGVYESFDHGATWRFAANLPVTQFYKVAVDDDLPFYNVYGGTQDNSTQGGPSRTDNVSGIRNSDWVITLFADGHQPATEPGNPDIVYSEWQEGNLVRYDRKSGEIVYVRPQPDAGDPPDRFNWDAPILVSPHSPKRLYYASQRVWRSDDRGDSWRPVSVDLTRGVDRLRQPLMGRLWSWDAAWDLLAMSAYSTITSLAESPKQEGLLYAGTDDGLLQVSEDGGASWRKIEIAALGAPAGAFVNDVKADLFDADTVYVALDHHKAGDFEPYLVQSSDRGRSWRSIAGDLPDRHLVWRLVQDHVKKDLLFAATEFGVFATVDGGGKWVELTGGVPTISFRDLAIQRRENDLVGASFGRGFYVLDDYSPLRTVSESELGREVLLFPPRQARWYVPRRPLGGDGVAEQGDAFYTAANPPHGAVLTYYLAEGFTKREEQRKKAEKPLVEKGEDTPFPSWETLAAERAEAEPAIELTVRDAKGDVVRRLTGSAGKGFHRVAWDLRWPATDAQREKGGSFTGALAAPGRYTVSMAKRVDGVATELAGPVALEVVRMREGALPGASPEAVEAFGRRVEKVNGEVSAVSHALREAVDRVEVIEQVLARSNVAPELVAEAQSIRRELRVLEEELRGDPAKSAVSAPAAPTISDRLSVAQFGVQYSTYGPTPNLEKSLDIAARQLETFEPRLQKLVDETIPAFERKLDAAGVPWTPGRKLP